MSAKLWSFYIAWWLFAVAQFVVVHWSVYALQSGHTTTSQFMSGIGPLWIMVTGMVSGGVIAFVASHWWFGVGHLRFFVPGVLVGLALGAVVGSIFWPVSR